MSAPLVFVDVETTGLHPDDEVWEVALIRRDPGEADHVLHLFVEHDVERAADLPEAFAADYADRYRSDLAISPRDAARLIFRHTLPLVTTDGPPQRVHLVGVNPAFDAHHLTKLLACDPPGYSPAWHHHLVDVLPLTAGYLTGMYRGAAVPPEARLPWSSDVLARALGTPEFDRHTALGDAKWARWIFDRVLRAGEVA